MSDFLRGLDAYLTRVPDDDRYEVRDNDDPSEERAKGTNLSTLPTSPYFCCLDCDWRGTYHEVSIHWATKGHPVVSERQWRERQQAQDQYEATSDDPRRG